MGHSFWDAFWDSPLICHLRARLPISPTLREGIVYGTLS